MKGGIPIAFNFKGFRFCGLDGPGTVMDDVFQGADESSTPLGWYLDF